MDMTYVIRECVDGDVDALYELEKICFPGDSWSREFFVDAVKNESYVVLCVENLQMSKIIGYAVFYGAADQGDLANIAVLPDCRGLGIGKKLLGEILKKASDNGVSEAFLEVRESNASAIGLYLSSGFAKIGKRRNYYASPREDAVIMMKNLDC